MKRLKLPKNKILKWFIRSYGIGGFENYSYIQQEKVLKGLNLILEACGLVELDFLGRFLIKISDNYQKYEEFLNEMENFRG
jgi:hypothetical protein